MQYIELINMKIIFIVLLCVVFAECGRHKEFVSKLKNKNKKTGHSAQAAFTCKPEWEAYGRKCYYVEGGQTQWSNAQYRCQTMGGVQVVLEDQEDIDFLMSKNSDYAGYGGYWLGCQDEPDEGQWQCGNSLNYWNSESDNKGLWDWNAGEPDGGSSENCLVLDFDGKLSDSPCTLVTTFNAAACQETMIEAPTACYDALGVEEEAIIPDANIQASSERDSDFTANNVRLNSGDAWEPENQPLDTNPYIDIDIGYSTSVSGMLNQRGPMSHVMTIKVSTFAESTDDTEIYVSDESGNPKIFDFSGSDLANSDTPVEMLFPEPVDGRIVRIYPLTPDHKEMRLELLGCKQ